MSDALVPVPPPIGGAMAPASFGVGDQALLSEGAKFFTCLDPKNPEHGVMIAMCLEGEDVHFDKALNTEIDLWAFVMHQWTKVAEKDGLITEGVRTVLIDKDGKRYGCSSGPVRRTLGYYCQFLGLPPWSPPIRVRLSQESLPGDPPRRFYKITQVKREPETTSTSKKGGAR